MIEISINSSKHFEMIDITEEVRKVVRNSGIKEGICFLYVPHTTAGITVNEDADPAVRNDLISFFQKLVPWNGDYSHMEGNSAAHILSTLVGVRMEIPVEEGNLHLGRWQGVFFCEFDGPRRRNVEVTIMEVGK
ncbi:secondary thiamine-phosphate synthase enzyme YjbQ [Athalassotoga saccharophila]|uniref:secondary thiamine-phosphate synthase enzyme YjbQ n=1 Tax=Athalassotoga saccharophila TaxID=1441386 RepID=UPI00137B01B2|nr:secondary thiamine-phosphate synthase enzyme YjbQ [Athalassotoga saccharophila]BBJ27850.1 secondary thiamine-phosphate synthase enzyme [Athalassotoga saccharophila]